MDAILNKDIKSVMYNAETYCFNEGINIELVYELPEELLAIISERSKALPTLYYVPTALLNRRLPRLTCSGVITTLFPLASRGTVLVSSSSSNALTDEMLVLKKRVAKMLPIKNLFFSILV